MQAVREVVKDAVQDGLQGERISPLAQDLQFSILSVIFGHLSITGNPVGGSKDTQAMLDYAAANDIPPIIEEFPHSQAAVALAKVRDGSIRFRAVLKNDLL